MINVEQESTITKIKTLLDSYSFDTNRCNIECLIYDWLKTYQIEWIYLATVEALYLGRYKVVSIKQILTMWERLGAPKPHFGGDFERFISRNLPRQTASNSLNNSELTEPQEEEEVTQPQQLTQQPNIAEELNHSQANSSSQSQRNSSTPIVNSSHAQLITKIIKQDFPTTKISQPQTYKFPQPQDEFGFIPTTSIFHEYREEIGDDYLSPHTGIKSFSPTPDFSEFFQKLKSFADSQNQNK